MMTPQEVQDRIIQIAQIAADSEKDMALRQLRRESGCSIQSLRKDLGRALRAAREVRREAAEETVVDEINREWFVITQGSSVRIGRIDTAVDRIRIGDEVQEVERQEVTLLKKADFVTLMAPMTPDDTGADSAGELWLRSPHRRQYLGFVCDPDLPEIHEGKINLWRGFGVEPQGGDASRFTEYVLDVLANGNEVIAKYILDWLALKVQQPGRVMGVMPILYSEQEGSGKSTLCFIMRMIFGAHGRMIGTNDMIGRFNKWALGAMFVQCDELDLSGRASKMEKVRSLLTTDRINIEGKGVDIVESVSQLGIIATTNIETSVPISRFDRRMLPQEVSDKRVGDHDYWAVFYRWLNHGGIAVILDFLMKRDIAGFSPQRDRVQTAMAETLKIAGLRGVYQWWSECLDAGMVRGGASSGATGNNGVDRNHENPVEIPINDVYRSYLEWQYSYGGRARPANSHSFGQALNAMGVWEGERFQRRVADGKLWFRTMKPFDKARASFREYLNLTPVE